MSRKAPTPLRSTPSAPFVDTMVASQQGHIDDLVQKNRTLEHTNKKLKDELAQELARSKDAVKQIQQQWHQERREWREGCDTLQACHKLMQLRTLAELDKERLNVLKEQDVTRKEKLSRLQRDFKITMFQAREEELEMRAEELEEEVEALKVVVEEEKRLVEQKWTEALGKMKARCAEIAVRAETKAGELAAAKQEKDKLQEELSKLREVFATLQVTAESTASRLERTTLQLEGSGTANAELQQKIDDLKRNNADLKRQLDKWQDLETKGGEEVEALRKRRIELEVHVKEMEGRLGEAEKKGAEDVKALEKERRKTEKLKETVLEWREAANAYQADTTQAQQEVTKAQNQIEKLKAQLEEELTRNRPSTSNPRSKKSPIAEEFEPHSSEDEVVNDIIHVQSPTPTTTPPVKSVSKSTKPVSKARPKPKTTFRPKLVKPGVTEMEAGPSGSKKKKRKPDDGDDSEVEEVDKPAKAAAKGKGKPKPKLVEVELTDTTAVTNNMGKRKAASMEDDSSVEVIAEPAKTKGRGKGRLGSEVRDGAKPKKGKAAQPKAAAPSDSEEEIPRARKMRKLNIFSGNAEPTAFNFMLQGNDGGLNIPTMLSPVKETDAVPNRSASTIGTMGRSLIGSFTRRT